MCENLDEHKEVDLDRIVHPWRFKIQEALWRALVASVWYEHGRHWFEGQMSRASSSSLSSLRTLLAGGVDK